MTNEEALDELNVIYERLSHPEDCEQGVYSFRDGDYLEALDMAIKALEQQPWEDCISRAEVLDMATTIQTDDFSGNEIIEVVDIDDIKELPSVTPTRPTGKWIDIGDEGLVFKCSICGTKKTIESKYCPNCGAKMNGVETEVEDETIPRSDT